MPSLRQPRDYTFGELFNPQRPLTATPTAALPTLGVGQGFAPPTPLTLPSADIGLSSADWVWDEEAEQARLKRLADEMRSPLEKALDFLNIGLYPVANVVDAILRGDTNLAAAAWRGLTMEERNTFTDILKRYEVPGALLFGFVLDYALDINTYLGFGIPILTKTLKAVRGLNWVDDAIKVLKDNSVIHKIGDVLAPPVRVVRKAFEYGYGLPKEFVESKIFRKYAFTAAQRKLLDELDDFTLTLRKQLGSNYKEGLWKTMAHVREGTIPMESLPEAAQKMLIEIGTKLEEFAKRGVELKLFDESILDDALGLYMPHMYAARIKKAGFSFSGQLRRPSFTKPRTFATIAEAQDFVSKIKKVEQLDTLDKIYAYLDDIDAAAKQAGKEIANPLRKQAEAIAQLHGMAGVKKWAKEVVRFNTPIEDIRVLYGLYANEFLKYEMKKNWLDEVLNKFGVRVSPSTAVVAPDSGLFMPRGNLRFFTADVLKVQGFSPEEAKVIGAFFNAVAEKATGEVIELPEELVRQLVGVTKNVPVWLLPKSIADDLNKTVKLFTGDPTVDAFAKFVNSRLNAWKSWATAWRLPFHLRNIYSNWYQMWLGDVSITKFPSLAKRATDVLRGADKGMMEMAKELGVLRTGFFGETFEDVILKLDDLYSGKLGSKVSNLFELPQKFGGLVEDHARVMMFLDGLDKGLAPREAAKRVWKYLFNYDEVTPFEQSIKKVLPFYTWMKKNISLQIHTLLTNPPKVAKTLKAMHAIDSMADVSHEELQTLPSWMREFGYFKLPFTDKRGQALWAYIDLPIKGLETLIDDPIELIGSMTPLVSLFMINVMNRKPFPLFRESGDVSVPVLEQFPGDLEKAPFFVGWLPPAVMQAFGIQPMVDRRTGKTVLGWPKKLAQSFYTIFPQVRELANLVPGGGVDVEPEDAPWRLVSYATGVRVTPINAAEQKRYWAFARQKKLELVVKRMYQLGRPLTLKEMDAILAGTD